MAIYEFCPYGDLRSFLRKNKQSSNTYINMNQKAIYRRYRAIIKENNEEEGTFFEQLSS